MASTYENDLRLEEMATGENSGSWGTKTNTNLELIADAFSYGTETIADADTTITIADGAADAARSLALKINSSADLTTTRTITLAPNTTSKVWIIENNTSGGQTLTISAGSGSNITLANGTTKIIATDGIGAGSNVVELTQDLAIADMSVDGILSLADGTNSAPSLTNTGDTNTGLYFPAADEVGITTGGTQRVKVDSTGVDITGTLVSDGLTVDGTVTGNIASFINDGNSTNAKGIKIQGGTDNGFGENYKIEFFDGDGTASGRISTNTGSINIEAAPVTINEAGSDLDFRVESDSNTHALFVDAGNSRVAVGTSSVSDDFTVRNRFNVSENDGGSEVTLAGVTNRSASLFFKEGATQRGRITGVSGSNNLVFSAGTSERLRMNDSEVVFNDVSADIDFRVESDGSTHMIFVDAGNNRVGINDNTPNNTFVVQGTSDFYQSGNNTTGGTIRIGSNRSNNTTQYGIITSQQYANSTESEGVTLIGATNTSAENYISIGGGVDEQNQATIIRMYASSNTTTRHSAGADLIQYMDSDNVVFNDSGRNTDFRVESDSNTHALFVDASANHVSFFGTSNAAMDGVQGVQIGDTSSTSAGLGMATANHSFLLYIDNSNDLLSLYDSTNNVDRMQLLNDGTFVFNQTGEANADFRVESDSNANAFFVDAQYSRIGINNGSPSWAFDAQAGAASQVGTFYDSGSNGGSMYNGAAVLSVSRRSNGSTSLNGELFRVGRDNSDSSSYNVSESIFTVRSDSIVVNESGTSNIDFRVESDTSNSALFLDASESTVGINTTSTAATGLNITGPNSDSYGQLRIATTGSADAQVSMSTLSNGRGFYVDESSTNDFVIYGGAGKGSTGEFRISNLGNVTINGSLSKSSGSFRIPHPIASKTETHDLIHSFVEAPQADNIYRGKVDLVAGQAAVNIDTVAGMTDGTFVLLNREIQCFTSNETGWTAVRGSVSGNILTIEAQDSSCTDTISWLVIGERQDQHMYDTEWTDENGKVIVEPLKS